LKSLRGDFCNLPRSGGDAETIARQAMSAARR
jgi:hypothetical protein